MIEGFYMEWLPDGECSVSDILWMLQSGLYSSLRVAVDMARDIICSNHWLTPEEEEFLIRFVFNAHGFNL